MTPRRRALGAAIAVPLLLLTACTGGTGATPSASVDTGNGAPSTSAPADSSRFYEQQLSWSTCGDLECAMVEVPLDWTDPAGDTIKLAINRSQATDASKRIGSVLINPGGPGGSGLDFTDYFLSYAGADLTAAYDVVGFDPRGVGKSNGISCGDAETLNAFYVTDYSYDTEEDLAAAAKRNADFAAGCEQISGDIMANIDTVSAARDMDVIRAVLGDDSLNYMGFSYGTQLGATYAALYPDTVGHVVLDGAVDFLLDDTDQAKGQAAGFEQALTSFIDYCEAQQSCPLSSDVETARQQIGDLARQARETPLPTGQDGVTVNGNLMVYGIVVTLYSEDSWDYLIQALQEVYSQGTASVFYQLAGFYLDRDATTGEYTSNANEAFTAINCLDSPELDTWTMDDQTQLTAVLEEASPTFGWWFAAGGGCSGWPWAAHQTIDSLDYPTGANPILVVGTTRDPATPYQWAQNLTDELGNAQLLTYDGDGHTAYGRSNSCILDAVDSFMVDGTMPDSGLVC
ncbi:alpha/beta hydrolase [Demequina capsici]|uniref:Alpha/beta hydrolase n=1 Tax=Demequina capsici TaxID=3075620 RepID=A0AA96F6S6_9MICO|nr:alpha/beta hydrolase [Demequina sp. OYTSA14]WNM24858.1 alpha/beta hydrolase [Demequina sp. OYTSA14]